MTLCVPTVQHTGSKFITAHLLAGQTKRDIKKGYVGPGVYFDHLWPHKWEWWQPLLDQFPAIVPLRHPSAVYESWRARGRPFREMTDQWRVLIEKVDPYQPYYLPLDVEDRQGYLDRINTELGMNLTTEWKVVHSKWGTNIDWRTHYPPDHVQEFIDQYQSFFDRFYSPPLRRVF